MKIRFAGLSYRIFFTSSTTPDRPFAMAWASARKALFGPGARQCIASRNGPIGIRPPKCWRASPSCASESIGAPAIQTSRNTMVSSAVFDVDAPLSPNERVAGPIHNRQAGNDWRQRRSAGYIRRYKSGSPNQSQVGIAIGLKPGSGTHCRGAPESASTTG